MGKIVVFVLLWLAAFVLFKTRKSWGEITLEDKTNNLSSTTVSLIVALPLLVFVLMFSCTSIYSIDEGEGVVLLQFGRVYSVDTEPGVNVKRPWASTVEWRTRLKAINQKLEARTNDDMKVTIDLTIWWAVQPNKLDDLYANVARDYETLEEGFVIPGIRSAVRDEIAKVDYRELNSNREKYAQSITKYVASQLIQKFIVIDKVNIKNVIPPPSVNESIEQKLQAKQQMEKKEFELETAKKEADIQRERAKGIRDAQSIIQQKLTPLYVQWYAVEMMKSLSDSPNTTYIFAPTSMSGIGLPVVYGSGMNK